MAESFNLRQSDPINNIAGASFISQNQIDQILHSQYGPFKYSPTGYVPCEEHLLDANKSNKQVVADHLKCKAAAKEDERIQARIKQPGQLLQEIYKDFDVFDFKRTGVITKDQMEQEFGVFGSSNENETRKAPERKLTKEQRMIADILYDSFLNDQSSQTHSLAKARVEQMEVIYDPNFQKAYADLKHELSDKKTVDQLALKNFSKLSNGLTIDPTMQGLTAEERGAAEVLRGYYDFQVKDAVDFDSSSFLGKCWMGGQSKQDAIAQTMNAEFDQNRPNYMNSK